MNASRGYDFAFDLAIDANAPLGPDLLDFGKYRAVRVDQDLSDAVVITQVDEQDAPVVSNAVDPT